jgi:hypothetical protein
MSPQLSQCQRLHLFLMNVLQPQCTRLTGHWGVLRMLLLWLLVVTAVGQQHQVQQQQQRRRQLAVQGQGLQRLR